MSWLGGITRPLYVRWLYCKHIDIDGTLRQIAVKQYNEPTELVTVLGGQLSIRQVSWTVYIPSRSI